MEFIVELLEVILKNSMISFDGEYFEKIPDHGQQVR